MAHPDITIQVGRKRMAAHAERVPLPQATDILMEYSHRNPRGLRAFADMIGYRIVDYEEWVRVLINIVAVVSLTATDLQKK